jgi:hypothetical protein
MVFEQHRSRWSADIAVVNSPRVDDEAVLVEGALEADAEVEAPGAFVVSTVLRTGPVEVGLERRKQGQVRVTAG